MSSQEGVSSPISIIRNSVLVWVCGTFLSMGCSGVEETSNEDSLSQAFSKIAPEELIFDVYLDQVLVLDNIRFAAGDEQYKEIEIPLSHFELLENGNINNTVPYDVKIDYFVVNRTGGDPHHIVTGLLDNRLFGSGDSRINPVDATFIYHDINSNEIPDVYEYTATISEGVNVRFAVDGTNISLNVATVDANLQDILIASQDSSLEYVTNNNLTLQANPDFSVETWFAFDAVRVHAESICYGGPSASYTISALENTLSKDFLVFGAKNETNFLYGVRGTSVQDLGSTRISGSLEAEFLLNDSISMFLVPNLTQGHVQAFVNSDFSGQSCVFSLTSPPLLD